MNLDLQTDAERAAVLGAFYSGHRVRNRTLLAERAGGAA